MKTRLPAIAALGAAIASVVGCATGGALTHHSPPTISEIGGQRTYENVPTVVRFSVDDPDTPLEQLRLSALSQNSVLIPASNIAFSGSGARRTMTISPRADQFGKTEITVEVSDGRLSSHRTFPIEVISVVGVPTIPGINSPKR